jgi:hypothetical protein
MTTLMLGKQLELGYYQRWIRQQHSRAHSPLDLGPEPDILRQPQSGIARPNRQQEFLLACQELVHGRHKASKKCFRAPAK